MQITEKRVPHTYFNSDEEFNHLYPLTIQAQAMRHWTPLRVAKNAARFLAVKKNARILDIGSGPGKFCLAAAYFRPQALYYGIEQRRRLVNHAENAREVLQLDNVLFMHGNFTKLNLRHYDHFYFYNAFYENLSGTEKIDDAIAYSNELYQYYNRYLYMQLDMKPSGTRLVTYHSMEDEVPISYQMVRTELNDQLKYWIKI